MLIIAPAAFTTWDALARLAAEHLTECPEWMILEHTQRAARDFFRRSGIWRTKEATLLTTVAGQGEYDHTPETNAELARVFSAWNGLDEIEVENPGDWADTPDVQMDTTWKIGARDLNKLWLSPLPETADVIVKGTVVYIPTNDGVGIPTHAYDEWGSQIAGGGAARLMLQANKPWTNPGMVPALRGDFEAAVRSASNQAGPVKRKPLRVTPW